MKPTLQFAESPAHRDSFRARRGVRFPKTDYCFRPPTDFGSRCRGEGNPSFRRISKAYFDNEARTHFVTEAAFFALIVMTAAVPVAKGITGLFEFIQTLGVL